MPISHEILKQQDTAFGEKKLTVRLKGLPDSSSKQYIDDVLSTRVFLQGYATTSAERVGANTYDIVVKQAS